MERTPNMSLEKVELTIRDGGLVAVVEIPKFDPRAEVIVWGTRYFVYTDDPHVYREAYTAWAPVKR